MRILLAGLAGAIAMFAWTTVAHVLTPLGSTGLSRIPNEPSVIATMHQSIGDKSGLFFFPWVDPNDPNAMTKEAQLMKTGPSGLLLYHPAIASMMTWQQPAMEFAKQLVTSLIIAFLVSMTALGTYVGRAGFVALLGLAAGSTTNISYWIWYGFPTAYSLAYTFIDVVAYIAAGLAIAAIVRPRMAT
jgi:hypothetical protein